VQSAAGRVIGNDGFDIRRRGDTDSGGWVEQMDGGGDQSPCLRDVVIAGGGVVGRSGEGEYFAGSDAMAQHGGTHGGFGAHGPFGAFLTLLLADAAVGFHQLSERRCGCGFPDRGWAFDQKRPVAAEAGSKFHAAVVTAFGGRIEAQPVVERIEFLYELSADERFQRAGISDAAHAVITSR